MILILSKKNKNENISVENSIKKRTSSSDIILNL